MPHIAILEQVSAKTIFDGTPIHESLKESDRYSVVAGACFKMAEVAGRMPERLAPTGVVEGPPSRHSWPAR